MKQSCWYSTAGCHRKRSLLVRRPDGPKKRKPQGRIERPRVRPSPSAAPESRCYHRLTVRRALGKRTDGTGIAPWQQFAQQEADCIVQRVGEAISLYGQYPYNMGRQYGTQGGQRAVALRLMGRIDRKGIDHQREGEIVHRRKRRGRGSPTSTHSLLDRSAQSRLNACRHHWWARGDRASPHPGKSSRAVPRPSVALRCAACMHACMGCFHACVRACRQTAAVTRGPRSSSTRLSRRPQVLLGPGLDAEPPVLLARGTHAQCTQRTAKARLQPPIPPHPPVPPGDCLGRVKGKQSHSAKRPAQQSLTRHFRLSRPMIS